MTAEEFAKLPLTTMPFSPVALWPDVPPSPEAWRQGCSKRV